LGAGEIDTLSGGLGGDTFVLGENGDITVDNGITVPIQRDFPAAYYFGGGDSDYALITDFILGEDVILLPENPQNPGLTTPVSVDASEFGDAGQVLGNAQVIAGGSGTLDSITGTISGINDVDVFQITLEGGAFSATTVGGASFDTQLFLFDSSGNQVLSNDDTFSPSFSLQSTISASLDAGNYFLAISSFNNDPVGIPPSFPGNGFSSGSYTIDLAGVESSPFTLGASPENLESGTGIFLQDDLIGIVQGVSPSDLSLASSNFAFV
jgi:hypothetical protein